MMQMIVILHRYLQGFKHGFRVGYILQINVTRFKSFTHSFAILFRYGFFSFDQFSCKSLYNHKINVTMIVDLFIGWQMLGFDFQFQS
ncbi:hypothetical protein C9426_08245 [Serratia sp. S1B]|nr:hypothetical protein C9426_08245 [Serratia sp. S1B]